MTFVSAADVSRDLLQEVRALVDAPIRVEDAVSRLYRMHPDPPHVLAALIDAGVNGLHGRFSVTYRAARAARWFARETGSEVGLGRAWSIVGQARVAMMQSAKALAPLRRARAAMLRADSAHWFHSTGVRLAHPLTELGRHDEALSVLGDARTYFEAHGPVYDHASAVVSLGLTEAQRERYRAALGHYRRARRLAEALSPNDALHRTLAMNLSVALEGRQRYRGAHRRLVGLEAQCRAAGDLDLVASLRTNRAHLDAVQGRLHVALDGYLEAERAFDDLGMPRAVAQCRLERAEFLLQAGLPDVARSLATRAVRVFLDHGAVREIGQGHQLIAAVDLLEGNAARARRSLGVARQWFAASGFQARVADVDVLEATALEQLGNVSAARRLANRAHETFLRLDDVERAARCDLVLGRLDLAEGHSARALEHAEAAWGRLGQLPAPTTRVEIEHLRARAHSLRGNADGRLTALRRAVTALEAQRGFVPSGEFMVAFLAAKASLYTEIVGALADAGWHREAFEYAERAKSRALVDLLAGREAPTRPRGSGMRSARIRRLRGRLDLLYSRLHRGDGEVDAALVSGVENRLSDLLLEEWLGDPELASVSSVGIVPLSEIQARLDDRTTLVEYFVTAGRTYVFVVRNAGFEAVAIDVARADLETMVRRFQYHVTRQLRAAATPRPDDAAELSAVRDNLAALHAVLVEPVEDLLDTERLVIAPHGLLHGLPFHALPDGDAWLSDRFEIWYAPSASVFAFCADKPASATGPSTVLALPDARAPAIAEAARSVTDALGSRARCLTGTEATAAALRDAAKTSRVLHLATHGMYRADRPDLSSVRLADTWLTAYDAYDLDVRCDLLTLAACETGVAAVTDGDEVLGLVRGFLFAGAARVLAGQWCVHDAVTTLFMRTFYGAAQSTGSWGPALRIAMQTVRAENAHPFFWAPFFLVGQVGPASGGGQYTNHVRDAERAGDEGAR